MSSRTSVAAAFAMVAALAIPAAADDTHHVDGEADARGADPRVAALDVAFGTAIREALGDLVAPPDLKAHKPDIDRELIGRARLYVASFKVTHDDTDGDTRRLSVDVHVDLDKLTARLGELGIALADAGGGDDPHTLVNAGSGKKATVLLRVITPRGVDSSYGASAARDVPGLSPLSAAVRSAGWQAIAAPASGPAPRNEEQLLDDDSARALAGAAGADLAVIVGVDAGVPGEVRGTREHAVLAHARVRVVDRAGGVVGEGSAIAGGHGTGDDISTMAIASAAVDAFADAAPSHGSGGTGPVVAISAGADEILVKVTARDRHEAPPWSMVHAIRDKLAAIKDARVSIRRLSSREVVIGVRGVDRADRIARDIRDLEHKITDTSFDTKVDGNVVAVRVSGSP